MAASGEDEALFRSMVREKSGGVLEAFISAAKRVLDHVADVQDEDGRFGYTYSEENGSILDGDGFSGCWLTPAFATLYRITSEQRYLDVARRAMDFYRRDVEAFHVYGGRSLGLIAPARRFGGGKPIPRSLNPSSSSLKLRIVG